MLLALALLSCLAQQADPVLAGRVVDEQGKPVENATVTLLARPIPFHIDPTREHRVVATTNALGAFRAALHADGVYSVWAATASAATAIAEGESAPGFVELRLATGTGPRTIEVAGLGAWPEVTTFRYRALVGGENLDFVPVVQRDGSIVLPPLPPLDHRAIEIFRAEDSVLWAGLLSATSSAVALPSLATWTVRVTDDKNTPIQGVDVRTRVGRYPTTASDLVGECERSVWSAPEQTDASGTVSLRAAGLPALLSHKDGYGASVDGWEVRAGKFVRPAPNATPNHVDVVLRAGHDVAAPLVLRSGAPLAVDCLGVKAKFITSTLDFVVPIRSGTASLPCFSADSVFVSAVTTLAPEVRELLRKRFGFAPPSTFRLSHPTALPDHPAFDADHWHCLLVIDGDGRPAANTPVWLGDSGTTEGRMLRTDRAGRLLFDAQRTVRAAVFARAGFGTVDVAANASEARLALKPVRATPARAMDAEGKPVAGQTVLVNFAPLEDPNDQPPIVASLVRRLRARSDGEGRFEVLLPPFPAHATLATDWSQTASKLAFEWDPAKPPELVLTVPRR